MSFYKISHQRWKSERPDEVLVKDLKKSLQKSYQLNLSGVTCELLVKRGLVEADSAYEFLYPDLGQLHDPFIMADMDKATDLLVSAIASKKRIWIYGDYDVDGITSISILVLFLKELGIKAEYYIPDRIKEGYGLNADAVKYIAGQGADLIITVDCGISNREEIDLARSLGIDVIVVDHHEVPNILPDAVAVLDPKRPDCPFPFKDMAGVGITYNFLVALRKRLREGGIFGDLPNLKRYLDLVALGTIADVAPLKDENRLLVKYGLLELDEDHRPGITALKEVSGVRWMDTSMVSFRLAPRINASGRMGNASFGVRLLTTDDPAEALNIARDLDSENRKRQKMEEEILMSALSMIDADVDLKEGRSIVLDSEDWHPGVIGIVASRLVDRFFRPVILLSTKDGVAKGSARSISGFHIYQGLAKIEDILKSFGGHKYAAGLSIGAANIPDLVERFEEVVREMTTEDDFVPTLTVDAEITLSDIKKYNLLHEAKLLMPFGAGNPEPLFLGRGFMIKESRVVGNNHLKMVFKDKNDRWDAIAFGLGGISKSSMNLVDVVFNLRENQWDRGSVCELNVKGIKST